MGGIKQRRHILHVIYSHNKQFFFSFLRLFIKTTFTCCPSPLCSPVDTLGVSQRVSLLGLSGVFHANIPLVHVLGTIPSALVKRPSSTFFVADARSRALLFHPSLPPSTSNFSLEVVETGLSPALNLSSTGPQRYVVQGDAYVGRSAQGRGVHAFEYCCDVWRIGTVVCMAQMGPVTCLMRGWGGWGITWGDTCSHLLRW